jgi:hypothetical protein
MFNLKVLLHFYESLASQSEAKAKTKIATRLTGGYFSSFYMRPARLERATFWFVAKRSIRLSYERENRRLIYTQ